MLHYLRVLFSPYMAKVSMILVVALTGSTLFLSACALSNQSIWEVKEGQLRILCTTEMIRTLVKAVGADQVDVKVLIKGRLDPHSYQLVKGDFESLHEADIIFSNGLGLEHGPSLREYLLGQKKNIALGDRLYLKEPHLFLVEKGQIDPHFWMDISLFTSTLDDIAGELSLLKPSFKDLFKKRAKKCKQSALAFHHQYRKKMQNISPENRFLVTSHDAFNYFARAYLSEEDELKDNKWKMRVNAPEGFAPESQISMGQIARVADYMQAHGVKVIFSEDNINLDALKKLQSVMSYRDCPIEVSYTPLYGDSMEVEACYDASKQIKSLDEDSLTSDPHPIYQSYIKMIRHNIDTIYSRWKQHSNSSGVL